MSNYPGILGDEIADNHLILKDEKQMPSLNMIGLMIILLLLIEERLRKIGLGHLWIK